MNKNLLKNLKPYWQILDFRSLEKTIEEERKNASFALVVWNILLASAIAIVLYFLVMKPGLLVLDYYETPSNPFGISFLLNLFEKPEIVALTSIVNLICYLILYASIHITAGLLKGKAKFAELVYFLTLLSPLGTIIFMLLWSLSALALPISSIIFVIGTLLVVAWMIYLMYLGYKIIRILYSLNLTQSIAVIVLGSVLYQILLFVLIIMLIFLAIIIFLIIKK